MFPVEVAAVILLVSLAFGAAKAKETNEDFHFGWAPFLFIWKGLHVTPKLSKDDMEYFILMDEGVRLEVPADTRNGEALKISSFRTGHQIGWQLLEYPEQGTSRAFSEVICVAIPEQS